MSSIPRPPSGPLSFIRRLTPPGAHVRPPRSPPLSPSAPPMYNHSSPRMNILLRIIPSVEKSTASTTPCPPHPSLSAPTPGIDPPPTGMPAPLRRAFRPALRARPAAGGVSTLRSVRARKPPCSHEKKGWTTSTPHRIAPLRAPAAPSAAAASAPASVPPAPDPRAV